VQRPVRVLDDSPYKVEIGQFVLFPLNHREGLAEFRRVFVAIVMGRDADGHDAGDVGVGHAETDRTERAKREADEIEWPMGHDPAQPRRRRRQVVDLASSLVVQPLAVLDAAEVETQCGPVRAMQFAVAVEDHRVVHRTAVLRMRVGDDRRGLRRFGHAHDRLELSDRPRDPQLP